VLLLPKQVVVYFENGKTIVAYVLVEENDVERLFLSDDKFQKSLAKSCNKMKELIMSVV